MSTARPAGAVGAAEVSPRLLYATLAGVFFISGFSALLYQVVWQRLLGLFSGSDVRSVTIVIGAYLAGLGVGSLLGGLLADRVASRSAVRIFGLCNLGIAAFAFLSRFVFYDLLFLRLNTLSESPVLTLAVSFLSLLIPTTLMGMSLPLLAKALVRNVAGAAGAIGWLYGINTFGSAIGSLVAGWYLMGSFGYERAVWIGGGLSLIVATVALAISGGFRSGDRDGGAGPVRLNLHGVPREVWLWCGLVLCSGYIAISLELIWFRMINVLVESNAYTFAHMLFFVLTAYAIGAWLGSLFIDRISNPRLAFLWIQGAVALIAVGSISYIYTSYDAIAASYWEARGRISGDLPLFIGQALTWGSPQFNAYVLLPALLLLPPNILVGMSFPIVQKAVQTSAQSVGSRVGLVGVFNIVGNTLGSILTGTVLLHYLGSSGALRIVAGLGLAFLLLLIGDELRRRKLLPALNALAGGATALALAWSLAVFPSNQALWARLHGGPEEISYVAEDSTGVTLIQNSGSVADVFSSGALQGTVPFLGIHGFLGAIPALVHPNPRQALMIGLGSGGTPYAMGVNPAIERIRTVEIVGSQLPSLAAFAAIEKGAPIRALLNDPRLDIVIGDGRRELVVTTERFDIIQADAIQPYRSFSGMLYSEEFFQQARARLAPGGIMAQWRPTGRTQESFMRVFPYGVNIGDEFLLGSDAPIAFDKGAVLTRLQSPEVVAYLEAGGYNAQEIARILFSFEVTAWTPETPRQGETNTDLWPRDEYYLNRAWQL